LTSSAPSPGVNRPVVLVHGGRFAASCWDRVLPLLAPPVVAVDLPGRGRRSSVALPTVGIDACAEAIVEDAGEWGDIVLVGHSLAGVVLPAAAAALGDRVARMVFVSAAVPPDGHGVLDTISDDLRRTVMENLADGVYRPEGPSAARYLCNDMDDEAASFTMSCRVDESIRLLAEPVDLAVVASVPCTYVRLTRDVTLPPTAQEAAITALGEPTVIDLEAGHMGMISRPADLARIIEHQRRA
jgi:pimeloyl-ACP methyl ester carboxylesterase